MDSDAVLHENSEYYLGCIIWTSFHGAISSFLKEKKHFFRKYDKNNKNFFAYFAFFCREDGGKNQTFLIPKWPQKEALSAVKVSSNFKKLSGSAGDFWWKHPYIYIYIMHMQKRKRERCEISVIANI